jgi:mono/diheme cytochrome c family protein
VAFSLTGREAEPDFTTSSARPASIAPATAVLPDAKGKQEVIRMCTSCHGAATFAASRMTRGEWKAEVDNMIARGARGSDAEVDAVIDYLAQNLGAPARRGGKK